MSEDEVAAIHEAAHAVFAEFGDWTKLAGPVVLKGPGHGDVVMATDPPAIQRAIAADPGFDRDLPRIHLIRSLLAGPIAERMLVESGRAELGEGELEAACEGDYAVVAEQIDQLDPPRPDLLERLERDVRARLEEPALWSAVERFAAVLLDRRRLEADEAWAILGAMRAEAGIDLSPPGERKAGRWRGWLLAFLLWEAWWAWDFAAAPRPDYEMRTVAALLLGLVLPGSLIALFGLILLARRAVRGKG